MAYEIRFFPVFWPAAERWFRISIIYETL